MSKTHRRSGKFPGGSTKSTPNPVLITHDELDQLIAKLRLCDQKTKTLVSFLKENNLMANDTKQQTYRNCEAEIQKCFTLNDEKTFAYCNDVEKLMESMGIQYEKDEWRLSIDISKSTLKLVLLHKSNSKPSVPVAYSPDVSDFYDKIKEILNFIKYNQHQWLISCELNTVAVLSGLVRFVGSICFMCDWSASCCGNPYDRIWTNRSEWEREFKDTTVTRDALVSPENIQSPLLEIMLGIVKNFLAAVAKRDYAYRCLIRIFPKHSLIQLKRGILSGPEIRELLRREEFDEVLIDNEYDAWQAIKEIIKGMLAGNRSQNYENSVKQMLTSFCNCGVDMSLNIHYVHHHLLFFSQQLSTESVGQDQRHHRTAMPFELRYKGKKTPDAILAETCWWYKSMFEHYEVEKDAEVGRKPDEDLDTFIDSESSDDDDDDTNLQSATKRKRK